MSRIIRSPILKEVAVCETNVNPASDNMLNDKNAPDRAIGSKAKQQRGLMDHFLMIFTIKNIPMRFITIIGTATHSILF